MNMIKSISQSRKGSGFMAALALSFRSTSTKHRNFLEGFEFSSTTLHPNNSCQPSAGFCSSRQPGANSSTAKTPLGSADGNLSLPHLPVPPLRDTLVKYLRSVKPLLTEIEFENTVNCVKSFGDDNGVGPKLQKLLEHRAAIHENWLADWWLGSAYLEYRDPVVVFSSPGLVFPLEKFNSAEDQLRYAAKVVYSALNYKNMIDKHNIPQDKMGTSLLDMSQYHKLFGTNRTPGKTQDQLKFSPGSRHYVIAHKNHFFKADGFSQSGQVLDLCELLNQIHFVVESSKTLDDGIPVGILTSENRNTWGKIQEVLRQDTINAASIELLEQALFVVSIDSPNGPFKLSPKTSGRATVEDLTLSEKQTLASFQMIHGNGTNSGNRWFDKTLQFNIGTNGECGLTYEHSPAEGPPIVSLMDSIVQNKMANEELLKDFKKGDPKYIPQKLDFNLQNFLGVIDEAKANLGKLIDNLDMSCFTFNCYGKNAIKSYKFSPDSFIQMAIQSAFHRVHGLPAAHYESASTRLYVGGRTETIRSCSVEALEFSEALNSSKVSSAEKYERLRQAITSHKSYAEQAVRGYGVDRHLLGLKLIAVQNNMSLPEFFMDAGYKRSTQFRLSTSQVPSKYAGAFMCYGPLVSEGYGCCYNPTNNEMTFGLSAFKSCAETNVVDFKVSLQEVLLDMQTISNRNTNQGLEEKKSS